MSEIMILVVEDDSIEAMDIRRTLESNGYLNQEIASSGEDALKKLSEFKPDLILMDIMLNGEIDGIATAEIIKKRHNIPVIYLTAHSKASTVERAKLTTNYAYLIKPFDSSELKSAIELAMYHHKIEEILDTNREHFQSLFENAPIGIFHSSTEGKFYRVNKALSDMLGYESQEELINEVNKTNISEKIYVDKDKRPEFVEEVLADGKWNSYLNKYYRKDGTIMYGELSFRSVKDENSSVIYLEGFINDVTAKVETEKALRETESLYRLISENTGDVIWILDIDSGRFNYISPSVYHLRGYTHKEVLKQSIKEVMTQESYQFISENLPRRINSFLSGNKSLRIMKSIIDQIHKDGSIVPTEVVTTLLVNHEGQVKEVLGVSRDITERAKSEKLIQNILQKNEYAMAVSKMAYWEYDVSTDIFTFNPRFYIMLGVSLDDVGSYNMGMEEFLQKFISPDFKEILSDTFKRAIRTDDPYFQLQIEGRLLHPNGEAFWVNTWFRAEKDNKGKIFRLTGVNQDITERKKMEASLIESEEKYRTLFESDPDYTILLDMNSVIVDVNAATTNISGLSKDEIIGKHLTDIKFIFEEDLRVHLEKFPDLLAGHKINPFEARLIDKKGKLRWLNVQVSTIEKEDKISFIMIIASDITESKQFENEIKDSLREKEVLLQEIHHRVKNNMQIISSLLNIQTRYVDDEESINVLKESQNRVKSMAMIHEKLYRSKDFNKIYFADYIESLVWDLFYSYSIKKGTIKPVLDIDDVKLNIETSVPCGLIITELVSNSLKYAFPNSLKGELKVSLKIKDDHYVLTISDNGVGFPKDLDFEKTDSLGLQLVNSLTDQIDGKIELDSSHGTKFKITFQELVYKERI